MRRLFAVIGLLTLGWLAVRAQRVNAEPIFCPQNPEQLGLDPLTATYNNKAAFQLSNGRFTTDAGIEFYVSQGGQIDAIDFAGRTICPSGAKDVTIRVTDPWTGNTQTLTLRSAP